MVRRILVNSTNRSGLFLADCASSLKSLLLAGNREQQA